MFINTYVDIYIWQYYTKTSLTNFLTILVKLRERNSEIRKVQNTVPYLKLWMTG